MLRLRRIDDVVILGLDSNMDGDEQEYRSFEIWKSVDNINYSMVYGSLTTNSYTDNYEDIIGYGTFYYKARVSRITVEGTFYSEFSNIVNTNRLTAYELKFISCTQKIARILKRFIKRKEVNEKLIQI